MRISGLETKGKAETSFDLGLIKDKPALGVEQIGESGLLPK